MEQPDPKELAARVRAAEAYAGFEHASLEERTGLGKATIQRMGSPGNSRVPNLEERQKIADACGVPRSFMEQGFYVFPDAPGTEEGETLHAQLARHEQLIRKLVLTSLDADDSDPKPEQESEPPADTGDT